MLILSSVQNNEVLFKGKDKELNKILESIIKKMDPAIDEMRATFGKYFQALNKYYNINHKLIFK